MLQKLHVKLVDKHFEMSQSEEANVKNYFVHSLKDCIVIISTSFPKVNVVLKALHQ